MRRKYIFFDIDGTLIAGGYGTGYIPDSTIIALQKLRNAGHFLCIATGRSQAMASQYMKELGFSNMVSDGGYGITINNQIIDIKPLPRENMIALIDECIKKNFIWSLQTENTTFRLAPNDDFENFTHDIYMDTKVVPGLNPNDFSKIYKAYIACHPNEEKKLDTLKELPWVRFFDEYITVEPSDKAYGIKQIIKHEHGNLEDIIVFGDGQNDISMFCPDWTSVAMGNAVDELKKVATYVTDDVDKNGIYNACKYFKLF